MTRAAGLYAYYQLKKIVGESDIRLSSFCFAKILEKEKKNPKKMIPKILLYLYYDKKLYKYVIYRKKIAYLVYQLNN